ncbi:MAG: polysaccharide biosynthesis tyrosine autokinase [Armatimonadota bacterium]
MATRSSAQSNANSHTTTTAGHHSPDEGTVNLRELAAVARRRWRVMGAILITTLVVGLCWTLLQPRRYTAMSEILVPAATPRYPSPTELPALSKLQDLASDRSFASLARMFRSPELLSQSLDALPTKFRKQGFDNVPLVSLRNTPDENVVAVTVTAQTPALAVATADSVVANFIKRDLAQNRQTTATAVAYVQGELARVNAELHAARQRLAEFQIKHGAFGDSGAFMQYSEQIATLSTASDDTNNEAVVARATMRSLAARLNREARDVVVDVTEERNPLIDRLDQQLMDLETRRLQLLQVFVADAPEVQKVDGDLRAVQEERNKYLTTQITRKTRSLNAVYQMLQQQYVTASTNADAAEIRALVLQRSLAAKRKTLAKLPAVGLQAAEIQTTVKQLENAYALLSDNYQTLRISDAGEIANVRVLTSAAENPVPASPNRKRSLAIMLLFGVLLAVVSAVVLEAVDDRVHASAMVEEICGQPILAHVPLARVGTAVQLSGEGVDPHPVLEGARRLRSRLYHLTQQKPPGVLVVTSTEPHEGKSTVAINLALALGMDGKRVLLVDADLRRPSLYTYFPLSREVGLTSVLIGQHSTEEAIHETVAAQVSVLAAGPLPGNPSKILASSQMRQLIGKLTKEFDVVILDTPPVASLSDTLTLAAIADVLLMVVSAEHTRRNQLQLCVRTLEQMGAPLLGIVLNKVQLEHLPYRYGAYGN